MNVFYSAVTATKAKKQSYQKQVKYNKQFATGHIDTKSRFLSQQGRRQLGQWTCQTETNSNVINRFTSTDSQN